MNIQANGSINSGGLSFTINAHEYEGAISGSLQFTGTAESFSGNFGAELIELTESGSGSITLKTKHFHFAEMGSLHPIMAEALVILDEVTKEVTLEVFSLADNTLLGRFSQVPETGHVTIDK